MIRSATAAALLAAALLLPVAPAAAGPDSAAFALVIGVNRSVDPDATALRFADDDAVRFRDLFSTVGVSSETLTRPDANTTRLHPQAVGALAPPTLAELDRAVSRLRAAVASAKRAGRTTTLYLVYAGHGKAAGGRGYVTLEDARLFGPDLLARIIDPIAANTTHVVVDACQSYFAVLGRGPGGRPSRLQGFSSGVGAISNRPDIGLLLSTSSARESHEWAAFGAGVFSHEIRSGLYGAADADGDGLVSYAEIAAFVDRANAAVPNEQFRPDVYARPPGDTPPLLDLRAALARRIEVDAPVPGHHYVEDAVGVRWADFHPGRPMRLVRPTAGKLYVRRSADDKEYVLNADPPVARLSGLTLQAPHVAARGAAQDLFRGLFSLPFGPDTVADYQSRPPRIDLGPDPVPEATVAAATVEAPGAGSSRVRWPLVALTAGGATAMAAGALVLLSANSLRADIDAGADQIQVANINDRITTRNRWGGALLTVGGASLITATGIWLWAQTPVQVSAAPGELQLGFVGKF